MAFKINTSTVINDSDILSEDVLITAENGVVTTNTKGIKLDLSTGNHFEVDVDDLSSNTTGLIYLANDSSLAANMITVKVNGNDSRKLNQQTFPWFTITGEDDQEVDAGIPERNVKPGDPIWMNEFGTKILLPQINQSTGRYFIRYGTLSTPWDLSTYSLQDSSNAIDLSSTVGYIYGIHASQTGDKIIVNARDSASDNMLFQYDLSTSWDLSSASYSGNKIRWSGELDSASAPSNLGIVNNYSSGGSISSLGFKPDGRSMFFAASAGIEMGKVDLETPWDLSTMNRSFDSSAAGGNNFGWSVGGGHFHISADGRNIYNVDDVTFIPPGGNSFPRLVMQKPWDPKTTYDGSSYNYNFSSPSNTQTPEANDASMGVPWTSPGGKKLFSMYYRQGTGGGPYGARLIRMNLMDSAGTSQAAPIVFDHKVQFSNDYWESSGSNIFPQWNTWTNLPSGSSRMYQMFTFDSGKTWLAKTLVDSAV